MQRAAKMQNDFKLGKTVVPPTRKARISVKLVIDIDAPARSKVFAIFSERGSFGCSSLIFLRDAMITKMSSTPSLKKKQSMI